jgi:LSD1 subclass zinc finger protein
VQCQLCRTLNDASQSNQLGHIVCLGCHITLMYAYGAQSVKCAVCNTVTPAPVPSSSAMPPSLSGRQQHQQHQQQQEQQQGGPMVQAVLVENPMTLDDAGNEVHGLAYTGVAVADLHAQVHGIEGGGGGAVNVHIRSDQHAVSEELLGMVQVQNVAIGITTKPQM